MTSRQPDSLRRHAGLLAVSTAILALVLAGVLLRGTTGPASSEARTVAGASVQVDQDSLANALRRELERAEDAGLRVAEGVREFYGARAMAGAWVGAAGILPSGGQMAALVRGIGDEGLSPEDYGVDEIETLMRDATAAGGRKAGVRELARLDLLLTDAFLAIATHLSSGVVDPRTLHSGWTLPRPAVDVVAMLEQGVRRGDPLQDLRSLPPRDTGYTRLRASLRHYREVEARGGWSTLASGPPLRISDRGHAVSALRERLVGEMPAAAAPDPELFDAGLDAAVRAFQHTHGLKEDGVVGPATRAELNVPVRDRISQIRLNLERLRWLPRDLGPRYVRIEIPAFELTYVNAGRVALTMRIIGGRPDWRTPLLSSRIETVVLSPYWNIPPNIAEQEIVPLARRDPGYLQRNEIRVVSGFGASERSISPWAVNWSRFDPHRSAYRLRQDPGPENPLGAVKFLFPNRYHVYLHDTPTRSLFQEPERAFSHGCMRMEKPLELAETLLAQEGWDRARIDAAIARRRELAVPLRDPLPVHILYQTAWVDTAGRLQLRADIYGHDRRLDAAMRGAAGPELSAFTEGGCETGPMPSPA